MPGINGFEVARALRRNMRGGSLKIIAVSASVFADAREQAVEAGCDDFLPKPFREQQLLDVIGKALSMEWKFGAAPQPVEVVTAAATDAIAVTPPAEEIDAMLELSRRGDILGIKKRLAALATLNQGGYAAFVSALEPFVASYQMNRIRDALLKLRQETA
jgi:CheY-like chemotaxis protein